MQGAKLLNIFIINKFLSVFLFADHDMFDLFEVQHSNSVNN